MADKETGKLELVYGIEDKPPMQESIFLGIQHYLTMFGATIIIPILIADSIGMPPAEKATLIGTMFFVSGICTLLQTQFGTRLPIVQGGTFSFLPPFFAIIGSAALAQAGWDIKILEVQGAIIVGSLFEMAVGFSGLIGIIKRYLGPITIAPTIALIGLALYAIGFPWLMQGPLLGFIALGALIVYSQFLGRKSRVFLLFPVLLAIITAWIVAFILTGVGYYEPGESGYVSLELVRTSPWINARSLLPLQWGMPRFTSAFIVGMLAGYVASIVESVGDYYAAARMAGAPVPNEKRISRGIGFEGLGCLVAGLWGTGNGTTSYSENIGAIGITKVGSRYVVQIGAVVMIILGAFGKFGAFFTSLPNPIVGAMYCGLFGMIASVGISNLQFVDLNDSRNLFIIGFAFFMGLSVPVWAAGAAIPAAWPSAAQALGSIVLTIAGTGMAVAAICAGVLDNIVPGTRKSRGLEYWEEMAEK